MDSVTRKRLTAVITAAGAVVVALGLVWFQPWRLWVDETVREELPSAAVPVPGSPTASSHTGGPTAPAPSAGPRILARGSLISHEHATTGTAKIIRLADGRHTLRLEGLDTSSGPDLRVWLTDAPVRPGTAGWRVFDDGKHVSLGALKGNKGDQNYALPADVDWSAYTSVSIWCDRFDVSFGAAELVRV
ncbi:DM13 domain-containing protein [Streptomyces sp. NPDC053755]|uniref:DM13 domain-containing protein n=1 Tax=Streptomyces sp. NPDC053755 TaxID=3155815 RepID=UPI003429145F